MITFPLSWPGYAKIVSSTFELKFHQTRFGAEFSKQHQRAEINSGKNDHWEGSFRIVKLSLTNTGKFLSFLAALKAGQGTFYAFDPDRKTPSTLNGSFPGSGKVDGAGQTGRTLVTNAWPALALILKAGDLVQVGTQLLEVSQDVTSDVSGSATINFQPALRVSPIDEEPIVTSTPMLIARLRGQETFLDSDQIFSPEKTIFFEEVI